MQAGSEGLQMLAQDAASTSNAETGGVLSDFSQAMAEESVFPSQPSISKNSKVKRRKTVGGK